MARSVTNNRKIINTGAAWAVGLLIFFPILWTILTSFKTEAQAIADPPIFLGFDWTLENYSAVMERSNYMPLPVELDYHRGRLDALGHSHRCACRVVNGLRAFKADQGHSALDAFEHQDAACGRRALPDLPDCAFSSACSTARSHWCSS